MTSTAPPAGTDAWRKELVRLGAAIPQDSDPPLDELAEAAHQAATVVYGAMLDAVTDQAAHADITAILWSVHAIDDYGIYESAYAALRRVPAAHLAVAGAEVMPAWLAQRGDHDNLLAALAPVTEHPAGRQAFQDAAAQWSPAERDHCRTAFDRWVREDDAWEPFATAAGGTAPVAALEPIPDHWPADWHAAAQAFRSDGRVDLAWTDERDLATNFPRVLAIIELGHGKRWRDVGDLLNPLVVRRRDHLPHFADAVASLPADQRTRVMGALRRSRPAVAQQLDDLASND